MSTSEKNNQATVQDGTFQGSVINPDSGKKSAQLFKEELPEAVANLDKKGEYVAKKSRSFLQRFNNWRRTHMSDQVFLVWLTFIVGLFAGFGAHIFNRLISIVSEIFLTQIRPDKINWWLIFPPIVGIVLSGIYTRYIIHTNLTHGVTRLLHQLYRGNYLIKPNIIYSPIIGGTITLGLGGSAGSEGPIAYAGAAIGSNFGRWLHLRPELIKVLVGAGAAAGISGIFMSPIGGLVFALEFLKMEFGTFSILAILVACLTAYGMVFLCNGCIPSTSFTPDAVVEPIQYWSILALGAFCGLYALYYSGVINKTDSIYSKIKNPWLMNIAGGLTVGVSLMLFPALFGVGYPVVSDVIHTDFKVITEGNILNGIHIGVWGVMLVAALILIIKCWACGACNASGGVSSDFAPTMYAGAIAGFLFSTFCNTVFHTELPVSAFTLLGMAAVMASCVEAPLMTIFIVLDMGADLSYALGLIIAVFSSFIVMRLGSHLGGNDSRMMSHLRWFHWHDKEEKIINMPVDSPVTTVSDSGNDPKQ